MIGVVYFAQDVTCSKVHATKIYEEVETMEEAIKIVNARTQQSMNVGMLPYICDIVRDKFNRITERNIRFIE